MAMSDSSSIHTDWLQYHQHNNLTGKPALADSHHHTHRHAPTPTFSHVSSIAESTVVSTTSATPVTLRSTPTGSSTGALTSSPHANIGRIGKSARKRSRASRKAPTTLLNTDTTNFRAMVQQFTGVPSGQFPTTTLFQPPGPTVNFGLGVNRFHQPMSGPFGVQQQQQQNHGQYEQYLQLQEQQHDNDAFLHGYFNNPRKANHEIMSDGFLLESISTQTMSNRPSSSDDNRRTSPGGFLL